MNAPLLALTVRQPWAWLIVHGGKDVENRTWPTRVRGRILLHAAQGMTEEEYCAAVRFLASDARRAVVLDALPLPGDLPRGGIVGCVDLVDCVRAATSPWFEGPCGFVLRDPQPLPFSPCRGMLGFFTPATTRQSAVP